MIRLVEGLGETRGLHAGPDATPVRDALGHGLARLDHLRVAGGVDPVEALVADLTRTHPALILAGRRGQGGEETGLVPYLVAQRIGYPLIPDVVALRPGTAPQTMEVEQALAKGARRRLVVRLPFVASVHPAAPAPRPFAYAPMRRGRVIAHDGAAGTPIVASEIEARPFKPRPKLMRGAPAGASAAERLMAATGAGDSGGADVLVDPDPELAARTILAYLRRVGAVPETNRDKT